MVANGLRFMISASWYGASLHAGDFRILDAQTAAAEPKHRIEFVQFIHAIGDLLVRNAQLARQIHLLLLAVRQEFVQRRIEETDGGRKALQFLENAEEI